MRLHVASAGTGDRVAVLIHGLMGDHGTWHAVTATLVDRGWRVLAPDLRGHGLSPRGSYTPEEYAGDLVESLPAGVEVALGHSLGGLALSLAVERLAPARAIYSDPAFRLPVLPAGVGDGMAAWADRATASAISAASPRWSAADVAAEVAGFGRFDRGATAARAAYGLRDYLPPRPVVPSLVQAAGVGGLVDAEQQALLRERGFEVRVVAGAGHCIHRDDLPGFLASLDGWL